MYHEEIYGFKHHQFRVFGGEVALLSFEDKSYTFTFMAHIGYRILHEPRHKLGLRDVHSFGRICHFSLTVPIFIDLTVDPFGKHNGALDSSMLIVIR